MNKLFLALEYDTLVFLLLHTFLTTFYTFYFWSIFRRVFAFERHKLPILILSVCPSITQILKSEQFSQNLLSACFYDIYFSEKKCFS